MNNKNIFSNIALLLLTLSCHFLKENVTLIKKDYLNILWVDKTLEDNRKLPQEEISLRNKESKTLLEKSLALKKKKQFSQSIQLLENAIDKEISAEVYYEYANVLSSAKRWSDAIKAYEISLKLEYKRPELVLYNIACSYSLLNDEENTYKFLEKAIQKGYKAFEYMEKDPDLKNIRDKNKWEWDERIQAYALPDIELKEEKVTGFIREGMPRPASYYFLCKNGIVLRTDFRVDSCGPNYTKGKWKLVAKQIQFAWEELCIPHVKGLNHLDQRGPCASAVIKFQPCQKITDSIPQHSRKSISGFEYYEIKYMLSDQYVSEWLAHKKTNREPPQCNSDFKPNSLADLNAVEYPRN